MVQTADANDVDNDFGPAYVCHMKMSGLTSRFTISSSLAILLAGCSAAPPTPTRSLDRPAAVVPAGESTDPIDRLVASFSKSLGLWRNGGFPMLGLPATATPEEVIQKIFEKTSFGQNRVSGFKILEVRQVQIPGPLPDLYTAVLVETDFGKKIVLCQYPSPAVGWWSRVYDPAPAN